MDAIVRLLQQSAGQDKVLRVLQYTLRFILFSSKTVVSDAVITLEQHITLTRKITRTTRDLFYFNKGLVALKSPDKIDGFGRAVTGFGKCVWLISDHIELLYRIGIFSSDTGKSPVSKWARISNWLWLLGYLGSIALYARQLKMISDFIDKELSQLQCLETCSDLVVTNNRFPTKLALLQQQKLDVQLHMIQELIDCGIPAGSLGFLHPAAGSAAGVFSSLIGIYQVYNDALAKELPSHLKWHEDGKNSDLS
jgi:hypothetical protein